MWHRLLVNAERTTDLAKKCDVVCCWWNPLRLHPIQRRIQLCWFHNMSWIKSLSQNNRTELFWVEIDSLAYFLSVVFLYADEMRMDGEFIKLTLNILCSIVCCAIGLTVVLAAIGKSLGIRKLYTSVLLSIFEVKSPYLYLLFSFMLLNRFCCNNHQSMVFASQIQRNINKVTVGL